MTWPLILLALMLVSTLSFVIGLIVKAWRAGVFDEPLQQPLPPASARAIRRARCRGRADLSRVLKGSR